MVSHTPKTSTLPSIRRPRPGSLLIRQVEITTANIERLLEGKSFGSLEEADLFLKDLCAAGPIPEAPPTTSLEKAQSLIYRAIGAPPEVRLELAEQAVSVCPDCADAYVILAEAAPTLEEARSLFEQGVAAGERCLGERVFEENAGHFWATRMRPYMRARLGLARCLEQLGRREEAIAHYKDLIRLNPQDNQGVRYLLLNALVEQSLDEEADRLLRQFPDDASADWYYSRLLLAWRKEKDGPKTRFLFKKAYNQNPYVTDYLLGWKTIPDTLPDDIGIGDEDEAIYYAAISKELWSQDSALVSWLREMVDALYRRRRPEETGAIEETETIMFSRRKNNRMRTYRVWRKFKDGKTLSKEDRRLGEVLECHKEFHTIWERAPFIKNDDFNVSGMNPFMHVLLHLVVENQLALNDPPETRAILEKLMEAGSGRHEACHIIAEMIAKHIDRILTSETGSIPKDSYRSELMQLLNIIENVRDWRVFLRKPDRNSPCPCGSGKKFAQCCKRKGNWPPIPVLHGNETLPTEVTYGVRTRTRPGLLMILGSMRYATLEVLKRLPQDHPLIFLENASCVADALYEAGDVQGAFLTYGQMVSTVESLASFCNEKHLLENTLQDKLLMAMNSPGHEDEAISTAFRLAEISGDPRQAALYKVDAAEIYFQKGQRDVAESILRSLIKEAPDNPWILLAWARFLRDAGRVAEAKEAYHVLLDKALYRHRYSKDDREAFDCAREELEELKGIKEPQDG